MWSKRRDRSSVQCCGNDRQEDTWDSPFIYINTGVCANTGITSFINPKLNLTSVAWICSFVLFCLYIQQCSINSPGYGPLPPDAPSWCQAPFDPEGILRSVLHLRTHTHLYIAFVFKSDLGGSFCSSSVMAIVTCLVGLHFGHVIVHFKVIILSC